MADVKMASYGSWQSPITSDLIVADSIALSEVYLDDGDVYWLEGRPREAGRYVLVRQDVSGRTIDITPAPFNVRTRVHEYGGGAYSVWNGVAYFSNYGDQRLYRQRPGAVPEPISPAPPDPGAGDTNLRYADGVIDAGRQRWIGVREDHLVKGREAVNSLVSLDLAGAEPARVLVEGADFYSTPRLSSDGKQLAWLSWNHPNMPWMGTELWVADFTAAGGLTGHHRVAGGPAESIFQPEWSPDGFLSYVSDRSGWWNLYRADNGQSVALCPMAAEFGQPQWVFCLSTYAFVSADELVCTYSQNGLDRLALLQVKTRQLTPIDLPYTHYTYLRARDNRVAFRAGSATDPASIVVMDWKTRNTRVLARATSVAADPQRNCYFSRPQPIEFPTEGGKTAHGLYYPPFNPDYMAPTPDAGQEAPSFTMTNVSSHSLGILGSEPGTGRKRNKILIPKNSPLPHTVTKQFQTLKANQGKVVITVLEGESERPEVCTRIGVCSISDLPPDLPAGWPIQVSYTYETNGRVHVDARVRGYNAAVATDFERENSLPDEDLDLWGQFVEDELVDISSQ